MGRLNISSVAAPILVILLAFACLVSVNTYDVPLSATVANVIARSYEFSISFNHSEVSGDFYKVSPYDDALLIGEPSIIEKTAFSDEAVHNYFVSSPKWWQLDRMWLRFYTLLGNSSVRFQWRGRYAVNYQAIPGSREFTINKTIKGVSEPTNGYIHAFGFASDDIVFDSNHKAYTQIYNLPLLNQLGLTPADDVKSPEVAVSGIEYIALWNPSAKRALVLPAGNDKTLTINRTYSIIEQTEMFSKPSLGTVYVQQRIQVRTGAELGLSE